MEKILDKIQRLPRWPMARIAVLPGNLFKIQIFNQKVRLNQKTN